MSQFDDYRRFRDEVANIIDPCLYSLEWVDAQVWSGAFKVFSSTNAIIAVELKTYPTGAIELHGMFAAGDMVEILSLIERAEDWGRSMGCIYATISSRPGWAKVMKTKGYEVDQVTIRKVL